MVFAYPYKRKDSDFLITHSIKCVRKHYPEAHVIVIGDKVEGADACIEYPDSHDIRGVNVTAKMLHIAKSVKEFVYMNDDFFINDKFDFSYGYSSYEDLERKEGKASIAWQMATDNTKHWLEHNGYPITSYECHQPVVFNSKKLIETMALLDWKNNHFIKSIYFNVNQPKRLRRIENTKLVEPNLLLANEYLDKYGCFSVGQGFLTEVGANFIKTLI